MSILSESLTIGLLLTLVFGALFFYLYSRVSYVEKRVGLLENILIDIKMKQEQQPAQVLPIRHPSVTFNHVASMPPPQVAHQVVHQAPPQPLVDTEIQEENLGDFIPSIDTNQVSNDEMYAGVLDEVHATLDLSENSVPDVVSDSLPKLTVNYESMTKEELVEVAKKKGIRVSNRPGREKLLQLIRSSENMNTSLQPINEE